VPPEAEPCLLQNENVVSNSSKKDICTYFIIFGNVVKNGAFLP
jgi:hypothetical protein